MPCIGTGSAVVCGPGATEEVVRRPSGESRWCFQCRKRVPFVFTVTREIAPSYYDPWPAVECEPEGHNDGDLFPGRYREWD
jgi:hypothetical protein